MDQEVKGSIPQRRNVEGLLVCGTEYMLSFGESGDRSLRKKWNLEWHDSHNPVSLSQQL